MKWPEGLLCCSLYANIGYLQILCNFILKILISARVLEPVPAQILRDSFQQTCLPNSIQRMLTAVLFVIARKKEKPRCLSTIKWIDCAMYLHNRTLQVIIMNQLQLYAVMWLIDIMLIKRMHTQKSIYNGNLFLKHL